MNTRISSFLIIVFLLSFGSCTRDKLGQPQDMYFNEHEIKVEWTAYKYTRKLGVSGYFKHTEIKVPKSTHQGIQAWNGLEISIPTNSLESNMSIRNENILNYYFANLINSKVIRGKLISIQENGQADIEIEFNGVNRSVLFYYEYRSDQIELKAELDLGEWNAASALTHFEDCCASYHADEDGINLVWPSVDITISAPIEFL